MRSCCNCLKTLQKIRQKGTLPSLTDFATYLPKHRARHNVLLSARSSEISIRPSNDYFCPESSVCDSSPCAGSGLSLVCLSVLVVRLCARAECGFDDRPRQGALLPSPRCRRSERSIFCSKAAAAGNENFSARREGIAASNSCSSDEAGRRDSTFSGGYIFTSSHASCSLGGRDLITHLLILSRTCPSLTIEKPNDSIPTRGILSTCAKCGIMPDKLFFAT